MWNKPTFENAPGLIVRKYGKDQWEARWQARTDLIERGFTPKSVSVWIGTQPTAAEQAAVSERCQGLQSEMRVWGRGGTPVGGFDGTISGLVSSYLSDEDSPFHKQRHITKKNTRYVLRAIEETKITDDAGVGRLLGDVHLGELNGRMVLRLHKQWTARGTTMAHGLVVRLRAILNFGTAILEDPECQRLSGALGKMKFSQGGKRHNIITADQAIALRRMAHACHYHSIALAQAFQFELMLRQKDVIGEWVPISEPVMSDLVLTERGTKWARGLRWNELAVDGDTIILRHVTSKKNKELVVDLKGAPMVIEELSALKQPLPKSGPIIVSEETALPYDDATYRRTWRKLARLAKIPDDVFNMDSRAGGISEATNAGADLEHVRHAATHSDIATTQGYSRDSVEKVKEVQRLRVASRNKKRTD
jgi:hypothetical protein